VSVDRVVLALGSHSALACVISIIVAIVAICLSRAHHSVRTTGPPTTTNPSSGGRPRALELTTTARNLGLSALTTVQLCRALELSYDPINDPSGQTEWTLLLMREQLLDEIERRDPAAFNRWLTTAPSPGDDPGRYLTPDR
jgi:hypothetical protein